MVGICIWMLRIPSSGSNLHSNPSNPFWMVWTCFRTLRIPFKWFEFAFECFEFAFECFEFAFEWFKSLSKNSILHWNDFNFVRMVKICIRILRIAFEWFEYLNASNPFWMVWIWIRMLRIPFEWFQFAFKWFESCSKDSNLPSNALNFVRIVRIRIRMVTLSSGSNLHWNHSNPFQMVQTCIRMLRIPFECFKFAFKCFESLSNS